MKFLLFNKNEELIATLKDVITAKQPEELNGEDVLEIETITKVEKKQRIVYKDHLGYWKEYEITGVEEIREGEGVIYQIFAESSFYETIGDYIEDKRCYNYPANSALEVALQPTRWEVGIVDDLGIESTNFYHISSKEAVSKVVETWKGELRTRITIAGNKITHRYIDVLQNRGNDYGKRFTYTKDLLSIRKTVHRDDVITALYGYGKGEEIYDDEGTATGGYGRRIDFKNINDGKGYVENNDARLVWGRNNSDGGKSHVFGKVEFDDCEDRAELKALTEEKLEILSKPFVTYTAKVIDLKAFGFEHEGVSLGDFAKVIDKEFKPVLRLRSKIIKIVWDLIEPENTEITLGNFIPSSIDRDLEIDDFISNFRDKQGIWDRSDLLDKDGLNAQYLKGIIEELNTQMNSQGGYVYISEDGKGLTTYDKPIDQNPTKAIQLLGGAFRIANTKNPDGSFNYRSFGTGDGFVADEIITGTLKGGKVKFNLTNGTLLIGDSTENYKLWFDGTDLNINAIVRIGASTVFDEGYSPNDLKDYIDDVVGDLGDLDLGDLAYEDIVEKAMLGETILSGGYIKTELLDVNTIIVGAKNYTDSIATQTLNSANSYTTNTVNNLSGSLGSLAYQNVVQDAMLGTTILSGGYIKTSLLDVNTIISGAKTYSDNKLSTFAGGLGNLAYQNLVQDAMLGTTILSGGYIKSNLISFNNATGTNVNLSGTITATSGSIGGVTIYNDRLASINTTYNYRVVLGGQSSSYDRWPIWVGRHAQNDPRFIVHPNGYCLMEGAVSPLKLVTQQSTYYDGTTYRVREVATMLSNEEIGLRAHQMIPRESSGGGGLIGNSSLRYSYIYLVNNPNVSSDVRQKSLIQEIPGDLIAELKEIKPKMYFQNEKWHFGYIAQDVETALFKYAVKEVGFEDAKDYIREFEMLHKDESYLSLIYAEIAVLKDAETQRKINDLENRLLVLEGGK